MVKISTFIVGLLVVSLCMGVFALFIANLQSNYAIPVDTSGINVSLYNKLNTLNTQIKEVKDSTENVTKSTGVFDLLGDYFGSGYRALKVSGQSIQVFDDMVNLGIGQTNLGSVGDYLKTTLVSIVIVLIVIGLFVSALAKWYT